MAKRSSNSSKCRSEAEMCSPVHTNTATDTTLDVEARDAPVNVEMNEETPRPDSPDMTPAPPSNTPVRSHSPTLPSGQVDDGEAKKGKKSKGKKSKAKDSEGA